MSIKLSQGQAIYQKTEVFDTAGNHTWTHPLPGQNIEVFVEAFGGGGGSQDTSGAATDGGDTIWNTASEALSVDGGAGKIFGDNSSGLAGKGLYDIVDSDAITYTQGICTNGSNHYGASVSGDGRKLGNVGDVKRFSRIVNGDINLTVGTGGTGNAGNGNSGAVIISYNITTSQTPVIANLQRRDWEHFGEITWRTAMQTAPLGLTAKQANTLTIDHERLDTGNKVTVDGSNLFTLQAGTYEFEVTIPVTSNGAVSEVFKLYNITDSAIEFSESLSEVGSHPYNWSTAPRKATGIITISSATQFRLDYWFDSGDAVNIGHTTTAANDFDTITDLEDRVKFAFKWRA